MSSAYSITQLDNEDFRVMKWIIEPGATIPMHTHEYEYVVVPLVTATMHVVTDEGSEIVAHLTTGESYTRPAGSSHQVENRGTTTIEFVEVEKKTAA